LVRIEAGGIRDDGVAERLGLVDDRLAGEGPAVDLLVEARLAASEDDVALVIDLLLGDRARPAGRLLVLRAGSRVGRSLTAPRDDVRGQHGRRRVGDLRGRHVPCRPALLGCLLEDRR
jgi:hypothetical protein